MTATEDLRAEHAGILLMLDILRVLITRLEAGDPVPGAELEDILEFLTVFVDKCHHGKEEDILFPALKTAGVLADSGPIGVLLHEHSLGREYIREMKAALEGSGKTGTFVAPAQGYIELLTQHIAKENTVLFPMAEQLLDMAALTTMHEDFEQLERERIGLGRHEAFHKLLDELVAKYITS